jgi:uncharacterized Zn finger protein
MQGLLRRHTRVECTPTTHEHVIRLGEIGAVEWLHCRACGHVWSRRVTLPAARVRRQRSV